MFKVQGAEGSGAGVENLSGKAGVENLTRRGEETMVFDRVAIFDAVNNMM